MLKNLLASAGMTLSKRFFLWLLGGSPDFNDKESVRQWCRTNHRWIALLAQKTTNTYDDQLAEILRIIFDTPELFDMLWARLPAPQGQYADNPDRGCP